MSENLLVSVLMTAYNRAAYIAEAIESVLASSYTNFELIVVDDVSSDKTVQIAKEYAIRDKRIQIFTNEKNVGDYPNRNRAASYAKGWLLMYVDSDDTITGDALGYVVEHFQQHESAGYSTIYQKGDIKDPIVLSSNESIHKHFFNESFLNIGPGGTVIKRELFQKIGGFPEKYGPANDMYYNIKVACNTNVLLLPYLYLNYRRHGGQEINNRFSYLSNGFKYLTDIMKLPELPLSEKEKQMILKEGARSSVYALFVYIKNTRKIAKAYHAYKESGVRLKQLL